MKKITLMWKEEILTYYYNHQQLKGYPMNENNYDKMPAATLQALERYRDKKVETGGFLRAVLSNDLEQAVTRADKENREALPIIVTWVFNELPSGAWGSYEEYRAWVTREKTLCEIFEEEENHD